MKRDRVYLWFVIIFASLAILFFGLWSKERSLVRAYRDASDCWRAIHSEGAAYPEVIVGVTSHPMAKVDGYVASEAERDRLDERLTNKLGVELRSRVAFRVQIRRDSDTGIVTP